MLETEWIFPQDTQGGGRFISCKYRNNENHVYFTGSGGKDESLLRFKRKKNKSSGCCKLKLLLLFTYLIKFVESNIN